MTMLCSLCIVLASCSSGPGKVTITIKSVGNEMKYDLTRFEVKPGQKVTIIMQNKANVAVMKHNVVLLSDKDAVDEVGKAALTAKDYLPNHPAIIASTPIAGPGEQKKVTFKAPQKPGEYIYICTYPGHYMTMQGIMVVKES